MAYGTADYVKAWASRTVVELRRTLMMLNLTTQDFTAPWVNGANQVMIPKPDWAANNTPNPDEGVSAETRARGGSWPTARRGDQDLVTFQRSGGFAAANEVLWEDAIELPWPAVERTRSRQTYEMRKEIDEAIYAAITAEIAGETSTPNFEALGSNTNSISRTTGKAANAAAKALIYEAIDDFSLKLANMDVDGDGDSVGQKYVIMRPTLFRIFREYMIDKGLSWDTLTADLLRNNSVLVGRGYQGRVLGIDVFSSTTVPAPSSTAGSNSAANRGRNHQILAGVRMGTAAAVRAPIVQFLNPSENQVSAQPAHLLRQAGDYGVAVLETSFHTLYGLDGGADS